MGSFHAMLSPYFCKVNELSQKITITAEFLKSSELIEQCPPAAIPEYAFIGRSNVGKSSLINFLADRKDLAMISGKPGKTKTVNHFFVDKAWYLVDLPGYGYAKASKGDRKKYEKMIRSYLTKRENLVCTFILIDARIPPQKIDLEFIEWAGISEVPFEIVFTKADKSKKTDFTENIETFKNELLKTWEELPNTWVTSAQAKEGREELLSRILSLNQEFSETISQSFLENKKKENADN